MSNQKVFKDKLRIEVGETVNSEIQKLNEKASEKYKILLETEKMIEHGTVTEEIKMILEEFNNSQLSQDLESVISNTSERLKLLFEENKDENTSILGELKKPEESKERFLAILDRMKNLLGAIEEYIKTNKKEKDDSKIQMIKEFYNYIKALKDQIEIFKGQEPTI